MTERREILRERERDSSPAKEDEREMKIGEGGRGGQKKCKLKLHIEREEAPFSPALTPTTPPPPPLSPPPPTCPSPIIPTSPSHVCCQYSQWITQQRNGSISPNFLKGNPSENLVLSNRPCLLPSFSMDNTAAQRIDSTKFSERQPF